MPTPLSPPITSAFAEENREVLHVKVIFHFDGPCLEFSVNSTRIGSAQPGVAGETLPLHLFMLTPLLSHRLE